MMPGNSGKSSTVKSNISKSNSGIKPSASSKSHCSKSARGRCPSGGPGIKCSPNPVGSLSQSSLKRFREESISEASRGNITDQSLSQLSALLDELTRDGEGTRKYIDILLGNSAIKNSINEHLMSEITILRCTMTNLEKKKEWTKWNNIRGAHAINSLAYLRRKRIKQMVSS